MIPINEIAEEHGLDEEDVLELLYDFLEYTREHDLVSIRNGLASEDITAVRNAAHSLKGAALNLKLTQISTIAHQIEHKCHAGTLDGVHDLFHALEADIQAVAAMLPNR